GSNVVNGEYYTDYDSRNTLGHYSAFRRIDTAGLREQYEDARATPAASIAETSVLLPGEGASSLPRFFINIEEAGGANDLDARATDAIRKLNSSGFWPSPLPQTSHPYRGGGPDEPVRRDFSGTHVGDTSDTSPFAAEEPVIGISTAEYLRNIGVLIRWLAEERARPVQAVLSKTLCEADPLHTWPNSVPLMSAAIGSHSLPGR